MEGTLWKWTNYFTGWQPRWFVLDNGILSYYKSQDDVNNGSKGSLKMAVCDVLVHPTDPTRLDLCIPGEQYFYVKAATAKERQMWLVALGSCKACLTEEVTPKLNGSIATDETDMTVSREDMKSKKSELRLYCDLLMQQVHSVKTSVTASIPPDVQKLDEATSLLSATCDTFIQTLDQVMFLAHANAQLDNSMHVPDSPSTPEVVQGPLLKRQTSRTGVSARVTSADRHVPPIVRGKTHMRSLEDMASRSRTPHLDDIGSRVRTPKRNSSRSMSESSDNTSSIKDVARDMVNMSDSSDRDTEQKPLRLCPTFFSIMNVSFNQVCCNKDGGIPVVQFLEACSALAGVFDKLSSTAFAPVKMDFTGNIKKINQKYSTNPKAFDNLQALVLHEKAAKESKDPNSATQALLWLKRGLEFISTFLQELAAGEEDLPAAAHKAYASALKPFHGWVVRGMFGLAMKAAPYKKDFYEHLSVSKSHCERPGFVKQVTIDIQQYTNSLNALLKTINSFYITESLHSLEQV